MGKKGTLREAPGGELKCLVRVAMYCFGKVGRKYLNKKREEERSVLLVDPGWQTRLGGFKDLPAAQGQSWRLCLAQVPAKISYRAGVNYRYKLIFGATWIYSVPSGLRDGNGFLPARDVKRNFDAQLRAVVSSGVRGARSHSLNHCDCRARCRVLTDSSGYAKSRALTLQVSWKLACFPSQTLCFPS